jgi:hypothetical protein
MERIEASYARDLYDGLVARFATISAQTEITVAGIAGNWKCYATRGQRSCRVSCFDVRGPEFLTRFEQDEKAVAAGRTPSQSETIDAVWRWLHDTELDAMYRHFKFVDWQKRELVRVRDFALRNTPSLSLDAPSELVYRTESAQCALWFRGETRSAQLYFYGRNEFPEAVFHWDQCELFRFKGDDCSALSAVLKRWLCDNALPSIMRKEFPWLSIGELADYYENGNPVEGEFMQSWDRIAQFYDSNKFPPRHLVLPSKDFVLPFIAELRRAGYDRKLRAGQSMWTLVLSRSRRHVLRDEQPSIRFQFREGTMDVFSKSQGEEHLAGIPMILSGRIEKVLEGLVNQPIT